MESMYQEEMQLWISFVISGRSGNGLALWLLGQANFNLLIFLSSTFITVLVLRKFMALWGMQESLKQNQKQGCKEPGNLLREVNT